jgi:hypothetical protein
MNIISINLRSGRKAIFVSIAVCFFSSFAQASSCITAGRINENGWAPQFQSVRLIDEAGRTLRTKMKNELQKVREVELTDNALLSACDGDKPLARAVDRPDKGPVPAAKPGRYKVDGIGFPKLQTGGELVELKVVLSESQIIQISR